MTPSYSRVLQSRVAIALADTWTAVALPAGMTDAILSLESTTGAWRFSSVNTVAAATEGMPFAAGEKLSMEGQLTQATTVYVACPVAPQVAILLYQADPA